MTKEEIKNTTFVFRECEEEMVVPKGVVHYDTFFGKQYIFAEGEGKAEFGPRHTIVKGDLILCVK